MNIISCKLSPTKISSITVIDESGTGVTVTENVNMTDFEDKLFKLAKEHDVQRIYFAGPKGYTTGLKNIIDNNVQTKFNNAIEIICI